MKKLLPIAFSLSLMVSINAQDAGIQFQQISWEQTLAEAKKQEREKNGGTNQESKFDFEHGNIPFKVLLAVPCCGAEDAGFDGGCRLAA